MTVRTRDFAILRLLPIALSCALCACASDAASRRELAELRAELAALRQAQERLERRVERAETMAAVSAARATTGAPAPGSTAAGDAPRSTAGQQSHAVPELTVVKLKPARGAPPKLDTRTEIAEPELDALEDSFAVARGRSTPPRDRAPEPAPTPAEDAETEAAYAQAMEALRTGNLDGAAAALARFADEHPSHPRADNALYFSALGWIGVEEFQRGADVLERLVREYPAGDALLDGLLKLAECRVKLKQPQAARALYHQVISNYPGTAAANQAQTRLASLAP